MDLTCCRGERVLFQDLSFAVPAGHVALVTGPNGSGKSTLLRTLAGLLTPLSGRVSGPDGVHHVGHAHALSSGLTLRRNVQFWSGLFGGDAEAAMDAVGLSHVLDLPVSALSAGQRQRAALGRLLLAPRPAWLLDEPTAALDEAGAITVARLLDRHAASGGLAVVATHRSVPTSAPMVSVRLG